MADPSSSSSSEIRFVQYMSELDLPAIQELMRQALSEPYSIYTYRYFINNWPQLTWMAFINDECVGAVVSKLEKHNENERRGRGYIAMLAVQPAQRGKGIASKLVKLSIEEMKTLGASDVFLETEVTNKEALSLYLKLGFLRDRAYYKYYLNGNDAWRLMLELDHSSAQKKEEKKTAK